MKKRDAKRNPGGTNAERANRAHHGGDLQSVKSDFYAARDAGVDAPRDERAVGMDPRYKEDPEARGKEFSGPGRRRDPDNVK